MVRTISSLLNFAFNVFVDIYFCKCIIYVCQYFHFEINIKNLQYRNLKLTSPLTVKILMVSFVPKNWNATVNSINDKSTGIYLALQSNLCQDVAGTDAKGCLLIEECH